MEANTSVRFCSAVRALAAAARAQGLRAPTFRSPPRVPGAVRTVRRRPGGGATVAVVYRGRPWAAVLGDCVEGVVVANDLSGREALAARTALWSALAAAGETSADGRGTRSAA